MRRTRPSYRTAARGALAVAASLAVTVTATLVAPAANAAAIGVTPARVIQLGSSASLLAIADDGTIYAGGGSQVDVWSRTSDGRPDVVKTFSNAPNTGVPSLGPAGLAIADSTNNAIQVIDPAQAGGPAVFTRTISGVATKIEAPRFVAWTPGGSLWVADGRIDGENELELLRFAPGANGNVAPVQQISGSKTGLRTISDSLGGITIDGLPGNGVVVAPAGVRPNFWTFTGTQSGNVAPSRSVRAPASSPHAVSQGVGVDGQGRVYLGSGDLEGDEFGRLDVFGPTARGDAKPVLTLGGAQQRFQIPLLPTVAPNGRLALLDATILMLGSTTSQDVQVDVFNPFFLKPGAPRSLKVTKKGSQVTVDFNAPTNTSRTPLTYRLVITRGSQTVLTRTLRSTGVSLARNSLPSGSLKVTVSASNAGGKGPGAAKLFTR